eukprot:TRINITY_DN858_c0_g1_i8.p2 TRINITY_DN858_c0_g1~~TRINITY_DN858_c0_g1_i8.p2  ORF type:complete len:188 (+),score=51.10 TRINITY_DN858_c0_g1_i8:51-614(+)
MLKYVLAVSLAAAAVQAQDCTQLRHLTGSCNLGQTLADLNTMTACKNYICSSLLGTYAIAHGSDLTKKLAGNGYGCNIEPWDGTNVGDVICMPSSGPSPPGPTPPPGPKDESSSDSGISGGAIFLIVFFVGFAVYFAAGMAYMHKAKGATGVEMVPHLEFWKDLPNLMKDGAFFIKNKVTGGGYSSV